ncbi:MAG: hypothetical protein ACRD4Z_01145, partial [Nitrososphaeraceae archaeon]
SAEPFNFSPGITSNPTIQHAETPYRKKYNISPAVKSNTANDCDMRKITESHRTTQEKPEGLTFEEYREIRPGLTFEEYREIRQTPVSDREYARSGKGWVRRNRFGEIVDFSM